MIVNRQTAEIVTTVFAVGSQHDFWNIPTFHQGQLFKQSRTVINPSIRGLGDTGYQGLTRLHANGTSLPSRDSQTPIKKASNRQLSRERLLVENVVRRLKVFRILAERYRNRRKRFALHFNLIAALYNLELDKPR